MTPTTMPHSGPSTAGSSTPPGRLNGDPYLEICNALHALLVRKRGYYGCLENPLENALGVQADGIAPWKYQVARIGEKCRRVRGPLRTIDIRKTLADIAGHAVVAIACLDYEEQHESKDRSVAAEAP